MKPQLDENKVISSGNFQTKSFGFSARRLAHIFDMLSTKTYSDNVAAPMREYATNGIDAMFEAGTLGTHQLEITLPTRLEPLFRVRDYGTGLTPEKVDEVYTLYGETTKEESNDLNGMLGIGSKSAYAYSRSWTIVSYVDGIKTTYNAFVDEAKMPQMSTLLVEETKEHNGVEIIIPVALDDINRFQIAAQRIYSYFNPIPVVHNTSASYPVERKKALFEGNGWRITGQKGASMAIMGNVAYPIDASQIINIPSDDDRAAGIKGGAINKLLAEYGLEIDYPIGDLEFAISREALYYTNFTKRNLTKRIEEIRDEVEKQVAASFVNLPNIWEVKKHYRKIFHDLGYLGSSLAENLKGKITWNGIKIENDYFKFKSDDTHITYHKTSWRRNSKLQRSEVNAIQAKDNVWVVINDLNSGKGSPKRLAKFYDDNQQNFEGIYVIRFEDDAEKKKFYADTNFDTVPVLMLSSLPLPATVRGAGNSKHSLKCFSFNRSAGYVSTNSEAWDKAEIDFEDGKGVWVKIDKFEAMRPARYGMAAHSFGTLLDNLEKAGVKVPTVYGIKPALLEKKELGDGWTEFFSWAKEELEAIMKKNNILQKAVNFDEIDNHNSREFDWIKPYIGELKGDKSAMKDLINALNEMSLSTKEKEGVTDIIRTYNSLGFDLSKTNKPTHDVSELIGYVNARYPLLDTMTRYQAEVNKEYVIDYINLIDERDYRVELMSEGC